MLSPDMTILAVADPLVSARFYQSLLGIEPVECQATFAMFVLPSGNTSHTARRQPRLAAVGAYTRYSDYRCVATASLLHTCQCAHPATQPRMAADTTTPQAQPERLSHAPS